MPARPAHLAQLQALERACARGLLARRRRLQDGGLRPFLPSDEAVDGRGDLDRETLHPGDGLAEEPAVQEHRRCHALLTSPDAATPSPARASRADIPGGRGWIMLAK